MKVDQIKTKNKLYEQALDLRYRLFFKEFGHPKDIVMDGLEASSMHYCISENDKLFAYGRLTERSNNHYKISQVVVPPALQGQGYGKLLLTGIICSANELGAATIELNSQVKAAGLYRTLGFKESGSHYASKTTGIPHVKMVLATAT